MNFFKEEIKKTDVEIFELIEKEKHRLSQQIELIASENLVSNALLEAQGSILTNKYAEGYPHKRYYGGCEFVDEVENLAINRAKELFKCNFANVQPHSGSQANQAVFLALLKPGDTILGMDLSAGGHLTHGSKVNLSGKWFNSTFYSVDEGSFLIDYDAVLAKAKEVNPKLIIAGASAYSREIDFAKFREIADEVGAYLLVDMAHYSGLIACGVYPSPLPYADVCTSTTHKTLRGPRGGIILWNDEKFTKKINSAVFPGLQGGPLMHVIAAKAVAFKEALKPEFTEYCRDIVTNLQEMVKVLSENGVNAVSGGTDCHVVLFDLRPLGLTGKLVEESLEEIGITLNKNSVPFDSASPFVTSGIRIGTAAVTTRGFRKEEAKETAQIMADAIIALKDDRFDDALKTQLKQRVIDLTSKFPIY